MLCHTHCAPSTGTQVLLPDVYHSEPEMLQGFLTILSLYFDKAIAVDRWLIVVGPIKHWTPDLVLCTTKGHKEWISFFLPVSDYSIVLGMPLTDRLRRKPRSLRLDEGGRSSSSPLLPLKAGVGKVLSRYSEPSKLFLCTFLSRKMK